MCGRVREALCVRVETLEDLVFFIPQVGEEFVRPREKVKGDLAVIYPRRGMWKQGDFIEERKYDSWGKKHVLGCGIGVFHRRLDQSESRQRSLSPRSRLSVGDLSALCYPTHTGPPTASNRHAQPDLWQSNGQVILWGVVRQQVHLPRK